MEILISRQPVFDVTEHLFAYELVLHGRPDAVLDADDPAPEKLIADVFLGVGLERVADGRLALITVDRDILISGAVRLLPADKVVIQVGGTMLSDDAVVSACEGLVRDGFRLCLIGTSPEELPPRLLAVAHIIKVDVTRIEPARLPDVARQLRAGHARLLALDVRNATDRDRCVKLGFELFEGYHFTGPERVKRRDIGIEHISTFRLLKMVRDPGADDREIEELLRRDVALSYKLLRMVNSAAVGGRDIWSIGHALRLLGREQIARWLALLLVTDGGREGVKAELMHLALVRARMCELLAVEAGVPRARGSLFLVGMISLLDRLLDTPMETLAKSMELAPDLQAALLHRADFYGQILRLVEAYEVGSWNEVDELAPSLDVAPVALTTTYLEALAWATEHSRAALAHDTPPQMKAVPPLSKVQAR